MTFSKEEKLNKSFLLIAGSNYYPQSGTNDWIRCYETREEAETAVEDIVKKELYQKGKNKGQIKYETHKYIIDGISYDWYEIIDLRDWVLGD